MAPEDQETVEMVSHNLSEYGMKQHWLLPAPTQPSNCLQIQKLYTCPCMLVTQTTMRFQWHEVERKVFHNTEKIWHHLQSTRCAR
uniref:Uncharacterized protein n=1 Tax=Rhizophora mucronata TaxID=61149 RepID=A0A2P2MQ33_RHIMU